MQAINFAVCFVKNYQYLRIGIALCAIHSQACGCDAFFWKNRVIASSAVAYNAIFTSRYIRINIDTGLECLIKLQTLKTSKYEKLH
jgi:hypothetical protein